MLSIPLQIPFPEVSSLVKVWFVLSLAVLSFLYGTAVGKYEWFPHAYLKRAADQAQHVLSPSASGQYDKFYEREGVRAPLPGKIQPGLTSITSSWKDSTGYKAGVKLLDQQGNVLHKWLFDKGELFPAN